MVEHWGQGASLITVEGKFLLSFSGLIFPGEDIKTVVIQRPFSLLKCQSELLLTFGMHLKLGIEHQLCVKPLINCVF